MNGNDADLWGVLEDGMDGLGHLNDENGGVDRCCHGSHEIWSLLRMGGRRSRI